MLEHMEKGLRIGMNLNASEYHSFLDDHPRHDIGH
jgi:hypothetical protein